MLPTRYDQTENDGYCGESILIFFYYHHEFCSLCDRSIFHKIMHSIHDCIMCVFVIFSIAHTYLIDIEVRFIVSNNKYSMKRWSAIDKEWIPKQFSSSRYNYKMSLCQLSFNIIDTWII